VTVESALSGHSSSSDPLKTTLYRMYIETLDTTISRFSDRFEQDQKDIFTLKIIEKIIIDAANNKINPDDDNFVKQFNDSLSCIVNCELLLGELKELHTLVRMYNVSSSSMVTECTSISSICDIMNAFPAAKQTMPQLNRLLKWYLTIPICSATAERTFSAMRRLKTWLRSKSSPTHLNNIMFGNIHKSRIDSLNISEIAKEFVNANDSRRKYFGQFQQ